MTIGGEARRRRRAEATASRPGSIAVTSEYGDLAVAAAERVGEIGEHGCAASAPMLRWPRAPRPPRARHRAGPRRFRRRSRARLDRAQRQARHPRASRRRLRRSPRSAARRRPARCRTRREFAGVPPRRDQQRVHAPLEIEIRLQPLQRHEDGAHAPCCGLQRELAQLGRPDDRLHGQPQRAPASSLRPCSDSIGTADGRSMRTSTVPPGAAPMSSASAALTSASRRSESAVPAGADAVEAPEALVDAVDRHARHAAAGRLLADHALDDDQRERRRRTTPRTPRLLRDRRPAPRGRTPTRRRPDRCGRGDAARDPEDCRAPNRRRAALRRAPPRRSRRQAPPPRWCASSTGARGSRGGWPSSALDSP